jgi:hypothetical protein
MITFAWQSFGVFLCIINVWELIQLVFDGKKITIPFGYANIVVSMRQIDWDAWAKNSKTNKKFLKFMSYFQPIFTIVVMAYLLSFFLKQ